MQSGVLYSDDSAKLFWLCNQVDAVASHFARRAVSTVGQRHLRDTPEIAEFVYNAAVKIVTNSGIGGCAGQRSQSDTGRRYCEHGK